MPMASQVGASPPTLADSSRMPTSFMPLASTSLGHFTRSAALGAKCWSMSQAEMAAAKESWAHSPAGLAGRSISVAERLPVGDSQARPRRPLPAVWRAAVIQTGPGSPAAARRFASSFVESMTSNVFNA